MPKPNYTHIAFILDRSGSMLDKKEQTIAGFNVFLAEQKKVAGTATVTLAQFDYPKQLEYVYQNVDLATAPELTNETFQPRGNTALVDAIGHVITDTGNWLAAKPETERPAQVYIVILTDGYENASVEYVMTRQDTTLAYLTAQEVLQQRNHSYRSYVDPRPAVADMIQHQRDKYGWQFVFMGADQDAIQTATQLNIGAGQTVSYTSGYHGTKSAFLASAQNMCVARQSSNALSDYTQEQQVEALKKDDDVKPDGSTSNQP